MFFKKEKIINIEKGKSIFFQYNGSYFGMDHDGVGHDYRKCNIPKDIEYKWLDEIKNELVKMIMNEKDNQKLTTYFYIFSNLNISDDIKVKTIFNYLNNHNLDTFSSILICENLKDILKNCTSNEIKKEIKDFIIVFHNKLNSKRITVDNSHINNPYMKQYDFSDNNIRKRLNNLLEDL
jgi:hypothetical protein